MNIKLNLQFDGTHYCGWQIQPELPTVQGVLSTALSELLGTKIVPIGCGRTDSGVHAHRYVCSFNADTVIPIARLPYALNVRLPEDIVINSAEPVSADFSANRSAVAKTYRYTIDNGEFANVFMRKYAWHYKHPLDLEAMKTAAESFIGTHDFIGFAASGFSVKTTVRTIYSVEIKKQDSIITIDINGNGFLYNMVRIIAGTLVAVGGGKIAATQMPQIISSKCRSRAGATAPPHGLCLEEVFY